MNHYTRMFPQLARPPATPEIECGLIELGKRMMRRKAGDGGDNGTDAFYTYLGQMMGHDLSNDTTPLRQAQPFEHETRNLHTPFLDLEVLYGGGPTLSPFLYDPDSGRGEERFLIGKTGTARNQGEDEGEYADLPRNPQGIALVGDPRQDENLILAQLHVWFLKWHNQLIEQIKQRKIQSVGPARATTFEQARRLLTWIYQTLALMFVSAFVDDTTFKNVQDEAIAAPSFGRRCFSIPIEFSVAAFRFGHSMVRDSYDYNDTHDTHNPAMLFQLIEQTGMGRGARPRLGEGWKIDMSRFLNGQNGHRICPSIARDMFCISGDPESILPVTTLLRGARMGLPSGQDVARALAISPITTDDLKKRLKDDFVCKYRFHQDTPLWYYVLREAELLGGRMLGPVGSRIVAETVFGALRADPSSYLSVDPSWEWDPNVIEPPGAQGQLQALVNSFRSSLQAYHGL